MGCFRLNQFQRVEQFQQPQQRVEPVGWFVQQPRWFVESMELRKQLQQLLGLGKLSTAKT